MQKLGELSNANQPLQAMDQEPAAVQSVLGELVAAKIPSAVAPFTLGFSEKSMDTYQDETLTTHSISELVSLMEQLQVAPFEDRICHVREFSYAESDDGCVEEYDQYPELQSLPEQVLQLIQLLT